MRKRIISLLLVFCMVLSLLPASALAAVTTQQTATEASANPFQDVKETDWYYDAVQYARINGFFTGTSSTAFAPNGTMTRGMFVTVLGRMAGVDTTSYVGQPAFTDVSADQYYAPYVAWAAKHGITGGTGDGKFSPNALIDRQQMATFFVRYFDAFHVTLNTDTEITTTPADIDEVAPYARDAVLKLWKTGLLNGDGVNFDPKGNAARAQAAALCMRTDKVVETWYKEPGVPSDRAGAAPIKPKPSDDDGYIVYAVQFFDGSRLIDTLYTRAGQPLSATPTVDKYSKENAIMLGWYTDPDFQTPFYAEEPVTQNRKVYAKYQEMEREEVLNFTSFAQMDQSPDLSFAIKKSSGDTLAADAAVLTVKDGSDPVTLTILDEDEDGVFTVKAENGFNEGCSYELTLADGWVFVDTETGEQKPDTIRTASFSIAMEEVANLRMSDDITYIQDTDALQYTVGTKTLDVLTNDDIQNGGSFHYTGENELSADQLLCIYVGTKPTERDPHNGAELLDPVVYVKVAEVNNNTVTFAPLGEDDQQKLYEVPDNFPILVDELPTGELGTVGTVNIDWIDRDMYKTMMSLDTFDMDEVKGKVAEGDFVTLYISQNSIKSESDLCYGEITYYDPETGEITYERTTQQAILDCMDLYQNITLSGSVLVTDEEKAALEQTLQEQVEASGFAEEAAFAVADLITKTDNFRENANIRDVLLTDADGNGLSEDEIALLNLGGSFELSDAIELDIKLITSGEQLHFGDSVQMAIGVKAKFEVDAAEGKVAIDLNATFVQEVMLSPKVKGSLVYKKILFIPVPIGVSVGATVDIKSYTALSFSAEIYTIAEKDQGLWSDFKALAKGDLSAVGLGGLSDGLKTGIKTVGDAINKIDELKAKYEEVKQDPEKAKEYSEDIEAIWSAVEQSGVDRAELEGTLKTLGKTSIASDLQGMMNETSEGELNDAYLDSMQALMDKYSEMLQKETGWIKLVQEEIFSSEVCYFGIVIGVEVDFVVRVDMSLAIGSSLKYEVGKRYNFWFKFGLFKPSAGSSTMDLLDEHFAFQFYVMGKLGVKAGIRAKVYVGIGSGKFASVGIALELGPYIKLYGFFIYEYDKYRPANTQNWTYGERMAGALRLEFGLYLMVGLEANALGSLFEYSHDFVDMEIPLLYAGKSRYYYGAAYEPAADESVIVRDEDNNSTNGITMVLPDSVRALSYVDLDTGVQGKQILDYDKYNIILSNPNFHFDPETGKISVDVPENVRYMACDLTITYLHGKLSFSQWDMAVTVPLVWTNLSTAELSEYYTASVRVGDIADGYQTVWSKPVLKNQPFDLPTDQEIKDMIGWSDYKYVETTGYGDQILTDLTLIEDKTYDYEVAYKTYTLTVTDIQNADGSTRNETFTAKYGEAFDFSRLADTGMSQAGMYTKFASVTTNATIKVNGKDEVIDLTQPINGKIADALTKGVTATANYVDDSVTATFEFTGLAHDSLTQKLRKGATPSLDEVMAIAEANGLTVKDITPAVGKMDVSTSYQVVCGGVENAKRVSITFHENGGSDVEDTAKYEGSLIGPLPTPTKTGYTFDGWYTDNGVFKNKFTATTMPVLDGEQDNIDLHAKWTANEYTVTFHVNGGNNWADGQGTKTVTYDGTYGKLPAPTRSGYGFVGWFTAADGGEEVTAETSVTITGDQTLYARWRDLIDIPREAFNFGAAESGTYSKGLTHTVEYAFTPEGNGVTYPSDYTFRYKRQGSDNYVDAPVNAGTYNVTVSRPADNYYAKFEQTYTGVITINKADRNLGAVRIEAVDSSYTWVKLALDGDGGIDDLSAEATFTYEAVKTSGNQVLSAFKSASADRHNVVYDLEPNSQYLVTVKVTDDPNYLDAESTLDGASIVSTIGAPTTSWADAADTGWYNDSANTFTLTTAAQLAGLSNLVNAGNKFAGKTILLGADIDLEGRLWQPIIEFRGVFNGQNHTIADLYVNKNEYYAGLFGTLFGTVRNVVLDNAIVQGTHKVGGIVGYANSPSVVDSCVSYARVTAVGTGDPGCVGGIVGEIRSGVTITNCVNYGPVVGNGNHTGGVAGYNFKGTLTNSANYGSVTGVSAVGGVIGQNEEGKVYNCFTVGIVKGTEKYVGAVVGRNYKDRGDIHQCYYLQYSATCNGSYRNAAGTEKGSLDDGDEDTKTAYFASPTSGVSRVCEENTNKSFTLLQVLNAWATRCGSAQWAAKGPSGYPVPNTTSQRVITRD